jgi:hypothetical protein
MAPSPPTRAQAPPGGPGGATWARRPTSPPGRDPAGADHARAGGLVSPAPLLRKSEGPQQSGHESLLPNRRSLRGFIQPRTLGRRVGPCTGEPSSVSFADRGCGAMQRAGGNRSRRRDVGTGRRDRGRRRRVGSRLAAIRQGLRTGRCWPTRIATSPFPPPRPAFARVAFTGGSRVFFPRAAPASRRGHGPRSRSRRPRREPAPWDLPTNKSNRLSEPQLKMLRGNINAEPAVPNFR